MLVIRLLRTGKKNQPTYKIVVTDKNNPPQAGRAVEEVGFYNPRTKERIVKGERAKYWISKGAQPSDTVHNILIAEQVIEGKKIAKHQKQAPAVAEETPTAAPAPSAEQTPQTPEQEQPTPKEPKPETTTATPENTPEEEPKKEGSPSEEKSA